MDIQFVPGQRWVSNTESELGLGIVVDTANRRVTVSFPAVGERRTYAISNAPLSRVHYTVGEKVSNADGVSFAIAEVIEQGGYLIYQGLDEEGNQHSLEEIDLESFVQFSRPQDRLFAGQVDKVKNFSLRVETLHHQHRLQKSPSYGLLGPRVQLLPHQLYIASQVAKRYAPRVLLADEVGLGKTIEAGLILHQQLITGAASRVLVVVPDSLVHQWLVEMSRRFNLQFTILDEERCHALDEAEPGNPFETAQCVLCSLSFLTDNSERFEQSLAVDWDLLIVDEAHHLTWSEDNVSNAYECIEALARNVAGLLLLTATPEQLGVDGHFARLRLLDPDRYHDLKKYRQEETSYQPVNELVQKLLTDDATEQLRKNASLLDEISALLGNEVTANFKTALQNPNHSPRKAIDELIQTILDRHGTGRVLFRNTRDAVEGFPQRELHQHLLETSQEALDVIVSMQETNEDESTTDLVASHLRTETRLGENWLNLDARVEWLSKWLLENRNEKILVICALANTASQLEDYLNQQHAIRSAVFHEGLDLIARDRAAAYFADEEEGAQVLICSEIGSEGRNFQFAHHLILFDLPLNADLLEQRIGRLDRIGQLHTVQIHVPCYKNSAQEKLMRWYDEGLNAFRQVCSIGQAVYPLFSDRLQECLINQKDNEDFEQLAQDTKTKTNEMQQALQQGRDRLLELNSCNPNQAAEVVQDILTSTEQMELADYMERVCDQFGVDQQYHSLHSVVLQPGDHMHEHSFPCLPEDGLTACYDRAKALVREDMQFHTWEHPMVTGSMDMILSGEFGNVTLCTLKLQALKPSTVLLECIFTIHCAAPKILRLDNYFSKAIIRVLIDHNHNDLGAVLTSEHMDHKAERVKKNVAQSIIKHTRAQITELIEHANGIAEVEMEEVIKQATDTMKVQQAAELERLISLSKVNPNIRQEEIEYLESITVQVEEYMQHAQLRLDAIRVAISRR
ncbi:MAG: RNA polymerase-associated protein RapA [Gammaproteobacteria bacterium]|nr:MAG: RNA polymerase-associated protein RapA [Gammaproteobacteria bacterium]